MGDSTAIIRKRVCREHLCRIFESEKILGRIASGELQAESSSKNPTTFVDYKGQQCAWTEEITVTDPAHPEIEIARCHQFVTEQGSIAASGKPDPKELTIGKINYRIHKKRKSCELCDGGDPIPDDERFWEFARKDGTIKT